MRIASLRYFSLLAVIAIIPACEATVPGLGVDPTDPGAELEGQFNRDVLPLLALRCDSCHAGSRAGIGFSQAADEEFTSIYKRVKAWPALVNTEAPSMSRFITKGQHEGPAWTSEELDKIVPWLQNEADFGNGGEEIETNDILLQEGLNTIDLGSIGLAEMAGTAISFFYERTAGNLLYFSSIKFTAAPTGAYIENPVFVMVINNTVYPDPINTFDNVKLDIAPDTTQGLGGGTLIRSDLVNVVNQGATVRLLLRFKDVLPVGTGEDNSDPFACKTPQSNDFTALRNSLNQQNCGQANCHSAGDPGAGGGGFDVSGWDSNDETLVAAFCKNLRGKVNIQNPQGQHIVIDKNNGTTGHAGNANANVGTWGPLVIQWATVESQAP